MGHCRLIQSTSLHPVYLRSILILSSHVGLFLTSVLIPPGFFLTQILFAFLCSVYTNYPPCHTALKQWYDVIKWVYYWDMSMFCFVSSNVSRCITIGICSGWLRKRATLSQTSRSILGPAHSLIQCVRWEPSLWVKCGADKLPPSSAENKMAWSYTSIRLLLSWHGA